MTSFEPLIPLPGVAYTPEETSVITKFKLDTLTVWRATGAQPGLRWSKAGSRVRYMGEDIIAFLKGERNEKPIPYVPKARRPKAPKTRRAKLLPERTGEKSRRRRRAA
jgi:hypothetical protein